jgi:hypothetical protein
MAGTSNVRVPEPLPDRKPMPREVKSEAKPATSREAAVEPKSLIPPPREVKPEPKPALPPREAKAEPKPTPSPREVKPESKPVPPREMKPEPVPAKRTEPEPVSAKQPPASPPPQEPRSPGPAPPPAEAVPVKAGKPTVVLLPGLTPPVFAKSGPHKHPSAAVPEAHHDETSDLVKSEPPHPAPPQPGGAPMAPHPLEQGDGEGDSEEFVEDLDEAGAEVSEPASVAQPEDALAAQKAKVARLGKRLRRKAVSKEQPPAEA